MAGDGELARPVVRAADYRLLMSAFPTGVAVVTTLDVDRTPRGLTCTSLASVTLAPPTLLVCLHSASGTLAALRRRGGFAVNLLSAHGRHVAEVFATADTDRFAQVVWQPFGCAGLPWLVNDAFAMAECRVAGTLAVGDHTIVLGEVAAVTQTSGVPLLYGMRRFRAWQSWFEALPPLAGARPAGQPTGSGPGTQPRRR
ncbi:flavin reductase family protein [Goodfellowiella coeruleoviolacea]|uniref:NADH-FMN oxidoreductase RutF, flavin reductase (DIM6/NTAB) family n=1 Tax=Goodfellowiella coeruleoviolacea TaxID=334858 RepID=A0AAE3GBW1_9PSEU|nr:flavin reductase family protein [Goodfellowiella coeruleoviolacea]MCP2165280.1 NADH-FMN oxidoreductase RutF, flavin reductase (DIM6/NTAB) family [Goodfellowiella coeruleoviolacea]